MSGRRSHHRRDCYSSSLYLAVMHQTQQALILEFGRRGTKTGLAFAKLPWRTATYYDRILSLDPPAQEIILADQKRINVDAFVRYRIVSPLRFKLRDADTEINFIDIFGRILSAERFEPRLVEYFLRTMLSSKRDNVMSRITTELKRQARDFDIVVVDVRVAGTDLPPTTDEGRMQPDALAACRPSSKAARRGRRDQSTDPGGGQAQRTVILAEAQRKAQMLRGEGEGQQTVILNSAFGQDPEFFAFYQSMEAYGAALADGTTMVLSPDSEFFRFFNDLPGDSNRAKSVSTNKR